MLIFIAPWYDFIFTGTLQKVYFSTNVCQISWYLHWSISSRRVHSKTQVMHSLMHNNQESIEFRTRFVNASDFQLTVYIGGNASSIEPWNINLSFIFDKLHHSVSNFIHFNSERNAEISQRSSWKSNNFVFESKALELHWQMQAKL